MDKISPFHIKNFRKQTGLSQKHLHKLLISLQEPIALMKQAKEDWRLISLENLKKDLVTIKIGDKNSLRAQIDYLRLTFPRLKDLDAFCENFLHCHLSEFTDQETRLMNYTHFMATRETSGFLISLISLWPMITKLVFNYLVKDAVSWNCF